MNTSFRLKYFTVLIAVLIVMVLTVHPDAFTVKALDADKLEGDSGITPFTFVVDRVGDISNRVSIRYRNGVKGDDIPENDETFTVVLHTLHEADQIDMVTAQGMIRYDDPFQILIHPARRNDVFALSAATNDGSFLDSSEVQRYEVRSTRDFRTWRTESEPLVFKRWNSALGRWFGTGSDKPFFFSSSGERHNWETVRFQPNIRSTGSNVLQWCGKHIKRIGRQIRNVAGDVAASVQSIRNVAFRTTVPLLHQ